jgi:excisionase family DNA binding protein
MTNAVHTSPYLRVSEVASELGCSEATVRRRIRAGDLPAVRLGDSPNSGVRIPVAALQAWLWAEPRRNYDA